MKIPAFSYSSLTAFEDCPRRYYLTRVAKKVKESQTEATIWGNTVHKALELRVKEKRPLPEGMTQWESLAAKFDGKSKVFTETRLTLTRRLTPTEWFAPDAWCRAIVDVGAEKGSSAFLGDWKTGKRRDGSTQLVMSGAMLMQHKPYLEEVKTAFIWLNEGTVTRQTLTRAELPEIWEGFIQRSLRLEHAYKTDRWVPRPSGLCAGWCPAGQANCEFWCPKKERT